MGLYAHVCLSVIVFVLGVRACGFNMEAMPKHRSRTQSYACPSGKHTRHTWSKAIECVARHGYRPDFDEIYEAGRDGVDGDLLTYLFQQRAQERQNAGINEPGVSPSGTAENTENAEGEPDRPDFGRDDPDVMDVDVDNDVEDVQRAEIIQEIYPARQEEVMPAGDESNSISRGGQFTLFPGGRALTVNAFFVILLEIKKFINISNNAFSVILRLFTFLLPPVQADIFPTTFNNCVRYLERSNVISKTRYIYACSHCRKHTWIGDDNLETDWCPICTKDITDKVFRSRDGIKDDSIKLFALYDVRAQIKALFLSKKFSEHVCDHVSRRNTPTGTVKTCYNTKFWQDAEQTFPCLHDQPKHLRVAFMADGVNVFNMKNSSKSTWPFVLEILNLGPEMRGKHENLVTVGMTTGELEQDLMRLLVRCIFREIFVPLWREGVWVTDKCTGERFRCKVMIWESRHDGPALCNVNLTYT